MSNAGVVTKREFVAALMMTHGKKSWRRDYRAQWAVEEADALLAELAKRNAVAQEVRS